MGLSDNDNGISAKGPALRAARRNVMSGREPVARRTVPTSVGRLQDRYYCPSCGRKKKDCNDCGFRA